MVMIEANDASKNNQSSDQDKNTDANNKNSTSITTASASQSPSQVKNAAQRNLADIDFRSYLLSTFFVCCVRSVLLHPVFIIVARKQVCAETGSRSFLAIARSMVSEEGGVVKAFTQGIALMALGSAVSETFHNAIFEYGRYHLMAASSEDGATETHLGPFTAHINLTPASAGAAAAWGADWSSRIVFSPFNVIAMRQMTFNCPSLKEQRILHKQEHLVVLQQQAEKEHLRQMRLQNSAGGVCSASATNNQLSSRAASGGEVQMKKSKTNRALFLNNTTSHMILESYRANGFHAFFRGLGFNLFVGSFTSSIFFGVYLKSKEVLYHRFGPTLREKELARVEYLNNLQSSKDENNTTNLKNKLFFRAPRWLTSSTDNFILNSSASVFASLASSVLANPYYVLLGKVQVGNAESVRVAFQQVIKKQGVRGLFSGALAGTAATVLENFLASTTYEVAMKCGVAQAYSSEE